MMVVVMRRHPRLRCDRSREAEDNHEPRKKLLHGDSLTGITVGLRAPTCLDLAGEEKWRLLFRRALRCGCRCCICPGGLAGQLFGLLFPVVAHHVRPELNHLGTHNAFR